MKYLLYSICFAFSLNAFAAIENSNLNPRHEKAIEEYLFEQCGVRQLAITEVSSRIDFAELGDEYFDIQLSGKQRIDQTLFNDYKINLKSVMWSVYDHDVKDWGFFEVLSATCEMQ